MRFIFPAVLLLAISLASPSSAQKPQTNGPEKVEKIEKAKKKEKKICRRIAAMGSNRTERVCMTRAEWEIYSGED